MSGRLLYNGAVLVAFAAAWYFSLHFAYDVGALNCR